MHPMSYKALKKIISICLVCLFTLDSMGGNSFFAGQAVHASENLSPVSRIGPIVKIEEKDGLFVVTENPSGDAGLTEGFKEDAGFLYLAALISQVIERFDDRIGPEGLKDLIRRHLGHIDFTRFKWEDLYKDGNAYCLPYIREDNGAKMVLKFQKATGEIGAQVISRSEGEVVTTMEPEEPSVGLRSASIVNQDAPPAIMVVKNPNGWEQFAPSIDHGGHEIINRVWAELWNEKKYELAATHVIVKDVALKMGHLEGKNKIPVLPIHVHCPPRDILYGRMYQLESEQEKANVGKGAKPPLPKREEFRLISHPGTWRDAEGKPRSYNLLVPSEDVEFLLALKENEPELYAQWLDHETAHLADRAAKGKGREVDETNISKQFPVNGLIHAYSYYQKGGKRAIRFYRRILNLELALLQEGYYLEATDGSERSSRAHDSLIGDLRRAEGESARLCLRRMGAILDKMDYARGRGVSAPYGRTLFAVQAIASYGAIREKDVEERTSWTGQTEPPMTWQKSKRFDEAARIEAMKQLVRFFRVLSVKSLLAVCGDEEIKDIETDLQEIYLSIYEAIMGSINPSSPASYSKDKGVRLAAAEFLSELLAVRERYMMALSHINHDKGAKKDIAGDRLVVECKKALDDISGLALGVDPVEKDPSVRLALIRTLETRAGTGLLDARLLIGSLFASSGGDETADGVMIITLLSAILKSGNGDAIRDLRDMASRKGSSILTKIAAALKELEQKSESADDTAPGGGSGGRRSPDGVSAGNSASASAQRFIDELIARAFEAGNKGENVIIGLDTSWIQDRSDIQALLSGISRLSELKNVIIVRGSGESLADEIFEKAGDEKTRTRLSNVVVLAPAETITLQAFDRMRSTAVEKKACLVGVDPSGIGPMDDGKENYIRLLDLLLAALKIGFAENDPSAVVIESADAHRTGPRQWIFTPRAEPVPLGEARKIYERQLRVITAA